MNCAFAGEDCHGRVQWHHVVSRSRLRREWKSAKAAHRRGGSRPWSITRAIADERNRVWLCHAHHQAVENRRLYVTVPESAWEFAAEYGLAASLEADQRKAAV